MRSFDILGLKVEIRCRRVSNPDNPSLRSQIAANLAGQHCYVVVKCKGKDGTEIPETHISYLGPVAIAVNGIPKNNGTIYSDLGGYRTLYVGLSGDSECTSCKFEMCVVDKANSLVEAKYKISNYSIFGPNSNSCARTLAEYCHGQVVGVGPITGRC